MKYVVKKGAVGEGARGGKVVGHYASGKPKYASRMYATGSGATAGSYQKQLLVAEKQRREEKKKQAPAPKKPSALAERSTSTAYIPRRQRYADIKSEVIDDLYDQVKKGFFGPSRSSRGHVRAESSQPMASYPFPQTDKIDDPPVKRPGSRGGRFIGYTRSGKPVYQTAHTEAKKYKKFSKEDHHDAAALHAHARPVDVEKIRAHMLHAGKKYEGREKLVAHKEKHKLETEKRKEKSMKSVNDLLDDVIKGGGEGSRGGKVIGHTRSGKPIYESHDHSTHKKFSKEDHLDAAEHHESHGADALRDKMRRRHGSKKHQAADQKGSHHLKQKMKHLESATGEKSNLGDTAHRGHVIRTGIFDASGDWQWRVSGPHANDNERYSQISSDTNLKQRAKDYIDRVLAEKKEKSEIDELYDLVKANQGGRHGQIR